MNNGLQGRYQEQLEQWNEARLIAAEALYAYKNGGSIQDVLDDFDLGSMIQNIKQELMKFLSSGTEHVNEVARTIYYEVTDHSEYGTIQSTYGAA